MVKIQVKADRPLQWIGGLDFAQSERNEVMELRYSIVLIDELQYIQILTIFTEIQGFTYGAV